MVKYNNHLYTFMQSNLYKMDVETKIMSSKWSNWSPIVTLNYPSKGLRNYGFGITEKGIIAIYGGVTEIGAIARKQKNFMVHEDLWMFNITNPIFDFNLVNLEIVSKGGFSKIFSLGGETLGILNTYFEREILILNIDQLTSYRLKINQTENDLNRTAFALSPINSTLIVIFGGYDQTDSKVNSIKEKHMIEILSVQSIEVEQIDTKLKEPASEIESVYGSLGGIFMLIIILLFYIRKRRDVLIPERELDLKLEGHTKI